MQLRYDGLEFYDSNPPVYYDSGLSSPAGKKHMKTTNPVPGLPEAERPGKAQNIHDHLNGNAHFTTPNPTLVLLQTHITDAIAKIGAAAAAVTASRMAIQAKRAALDLMENDTALLAAYVDNIANGNEAIIMSSGFDVRAPNVPVGELPAPTGLETVAGAFNGQLLASWDPVPGARLYELQTTSDPNTESSWVTRGTSTKASMAVDGLPSGGHCWVRVRAIGTAGPGPYSNPGDKTVP